VKETEGEAIVKVQTYNKGVGTRINYVPNNINQYTVIAALEQIIQEIKTNNKLSETILRRKEDE